MRAVDIMLSIPAILLAIITVAVLGPSLLNLIIVLGFTRWPRYTRVAYAQTLERLRPAVHHRGAARRRTHAAHPAAPRAAQHPRPADRGRDARVRPDGAVRGRALVLGLGIQPPTPSWGSIMSVGRNYVATAWWIATFPGICLFLLVLAVNLFGDYLRDRFDPRASGAERDGRDRGAFGKARGGDRGVRRARGVDRGGVRAGRRDVVPVRPARRGPRGDRGEDGARRALTHATELADAASIATSRG